MTGVGILVLTHLDSVGLVRSSTLKLNPEPRGAFQRRDQTPRRGPETHGSTPRDYPFKLKAVAASRAVAGECAAPVFCGRASGADAPKSLYYHDTL